MGSTRASVAALSSLALEMDVEGLEEVSGSRRGEGARVVLITGASGSLGSYIARLVYKHWTGVQEIRLFDRVPPPTPLVTGITGYSGSRDGPRVSYYHGDLFQRESLLKACVRVDAVFHCAALVENGSAITRRRMRRVNVEGTQCVVTACLECGVPALVFTGSLTQALTAKGRRRRGLRLDEATPLPPDAELLNPHYGGSKSAAEQLVLAANGYAGKEGIKLHTCSLRCPVMFGENDTLFVLTALKAAKQCCGYYLSAGDRTTTMQSLYFGNAAWAHIVAAQRLLDKETRTRVGGKFYYIGDYSPVCCMTDFMAQFLRPLGYRVAPWPLKLPLLPLLLLAFLLEFVMLLLAVVGVDLRSSLNRASVGFLRLSHSYAWDKAREELGYEPLYQHSAALARSMEYYRRRVL